MVAAGIVSLTALSGVIGSLAFLHLAPTGLSPVRNAVSQYGIGDFRLGYRVATIAFAVAAVALAVGIEEKVQAVGSVVALLGLFAAARALISWFPMDRPGASRSSTGRAHGLLALVAFASITAAAITFGNKLSKGTTWHALAPVSSGLGYAMVATLLTMALAGAHPSVRQRFGAVERAFYLFAIAWSAVFAFACAANLR